MKTLADLTGAEHAETAKILAGLRECGYADRDRFNRI